MKPKCIIRQAFTSWKKTIVSMACSTSVFFWVSVGTYSHQTGVKIELKVKIVRTLATKSCVEVYEIRELKHARF